MTSIADTDFQSLTHEGVRFRYVDRGQGPPVMLVHGFPDTPHSWGSIADALNGAGFRTVIPYLRGYHPDTIVSGRAYDNIRIGEDSVLLARGLGLEGATLVGHDWGASVVYGASALAPELFRKVVPIGVPHLRALKPDGPLEAAAFLWLARHFLFFKTPWADAATRRNDFAYIDTLYDRWAPKWTGPQRDDAVERIKTHFRDDAVLRAALDYYRALRRTPDRRLLRNLGPRALLVAGAEDFGGQEGPYHKSAKMFDGGGEVLVIPGAGHWPHRENEPLFVKTLLEFLNS